MTITTAGYFGGKSTHAGSRGTGRQIAGLLPWWRTQLYCEPFFGMGGIYFGRRPTTSEHVNDLNGRIAIFLEWPEIARSSWPAGSISRCTARRRTARQYPVWTTPTTWYAPGRGSPPSSKASPTQMLPPTGVRAIGSKAAMEDRTSSA